MGQLFERYTMELGAFDNMIIKEDWYAHTLHRKNQKSAYW